MQNTNLTSPTPQAPAGAVKTIHYVDPVREQILLEKMKEEQNLGMGILAGLAGAFLGAVIWAFATLITDYQIGWMAVLNGFLVGFGIRTFGKGMDKKYGVMGAVMALGSILLGNLLMVAVILAREESISILSILVSFIMEPQLPIEIMAAIFEPMDLLFYGIALYEGYRFSFRKLSRQEYQSLLIEKQV